MGNEIAVVGMACWYPGARTPLQFWENILARKRQFRKIRDERLPLGDYYNPDPAFPDTIYIRRASFIDGFEFDWAARRIPKITFESTNVVHWLTLEVAIQCVLDAGYDREKVPTEKTGVLLGNTMESEFSRSNNMRVRWPFIRRVLHAAAQGKGVLPHQLAALESAMETAYKSVFYPINEDTLAGNLANTIAGRVCNFFDFKGGGYVLDGACSSSLLAVANACEALTRGDLDMAIAGGVDISLDTFELVGFAKTKALTPDDMRVYDRRGNGFLPGEGCGLICLKRMEQARRDGNTIYAVLRGWGISSDGRGAITAPNAQGQSRALLQAYKKAGYSARSLDFIEGHGTGTAVGDRIELQGISIAANHEAPCEPRKIGMTSVKSLMGHTKAAAGIAGLIKAVLAVHRRIIPPTANCVEPHPIFSSEAQCLYPIMQGKMEDKGSTLRAGVSAMGFGGINCHITLESGDPPVDKLRPSLHERMLLGSHQETEVFPVSANSVPSLVRLLRSLTNEAEDLSVAELTDLSAHLGGKLDKSGRVRCAVVAGSADDLVDRLSQLVEVLEQSPPIEGSIWSLPQKGMWLGNDVHKERVGFLFPGQGSQRLNTSRRLIERFPWARELLFKADACLSEEGLHPISDRILKEVDRAIDEKQVEAWNSDLSLTEVAQPAICFTSMLWLKYLELLGVLPSVVGGHSLGELTAFHAAGVFDETFLIRLAGSRGRAMSSPSGQAGTMASLACSPEKAQELLAKAEGYVVLANINSPRQVAISGEKAAVEQMVRLAASENIVARELAVSNAFHSKLVQRGMELLLKQVQFPKQFPQPKMKLFSSMDNVGEVSGKIDLSKHFSSQIMSRVNFVSLIEQMRKHCDLLLEVGPGRVLTGLAVDILGPGSFPCLPVESRPDQDQDFNAVLATLFIHGIPIRWDAVFQNRLVRPYMPASEKLFICNPCERTIQVGNAAAAPASKIVAPDNSLAKIQSQLPDVPPQKIIDYMDRRGSFLAGVIRADLISQGVIEANSQVHVSPQEKPSAAAKTRAAALPVPEASASAPGSQEMSLENVLFQVIEERTGFPAKTLSLEMRVLDDLSIDSIKVAEILSSCTKRLGLISQSFPLTMANATLGQIVDELGKLRPVRGSGGSTAQEGVSKKALEAVLKAAQEISGYPVASINPDSRVDQDLMLHGDNLRGFIAKAASDLQIDPQLDLEPLGKRTLRQVAQILANMSNQQVKAIQDLGGGLSPSAAASWVRNFAVDYIEEAAVSPEQAGIRRKEDRWEESEALLLVESADNEIMEALRLDWLSRGGNATLATFEEAREKKLMDQVRFSHFIALLPAIDTSELSPQNLSRIFSQLATISNPPPASQAPRRRTTVAFVQFGGGEFGARPKPNVRQCFSVASFAASLFYERPDLRVRVVDLALGLSAKKAVGVVAEEVMSPDSFLAVGYDSELVRRRIKTRLQTPAEYAPRNIEWSAKDVVLVTGGAKGITAECSLEFARSTGVKMALVGSSAVPSEKPESSGNEISRTLERFSAAGLVARYYCCDVTDVNAVSSLVARVQKEMGPVTGAILGAGINKPTRLSKFDPEQAARDVAPKVLGALNLCRALGMQPLKILVGFTSIIGVVGMPANASYAFSNEVLNQILQRFGQEHPKTDIQAIAYSVWSEVGMGIKLGLVERLLQAGYGAISTEQGVRRFLQLLQCNPGPYQVVINGRTMSRLSTWLRQEQLELPKAHRFLEEVVAIEAGVEVLCRTHLSLERDPYIQDHVYRGTLLFPAVFGLEAMAQAAAYVSGIHDMSNIYIENIQLQRPIVVDPQFGVDIQVQALVLEPESNSGVHRVRACIQTEQTGFSSDHFSAVFVFGQRERPREKVELPKAPLDIQTKEDLYGSGLLFQGPLFQRLQKVHSLDSNQCVFESDLLGSVKNGEASFSHAEDQSLILGDPFFRDSLLQAGQMLIPQDICLPISIESWEIFRPEPRPQQSLVAVVKAQSRDGNELVNLTMAVEGEKIVERISGFRLRVLEHHENHPVAEELAQPDARDERLLKEAIERHQQALGVVAPAAAIVNVAGLHRLPRSERHEQEKKLAQRLIQKLTPNLKPGSALIRWTDQGKPVLDGAPGLAISISHDDRVCICVAGPGLQACDLAPVQHRSLEDWTGILDKAVAPLMQTVTKQGDSQDLAATRLWAIQETTQKALDALPGSVSIVARVDAAVLFSVTVLQRDFMVLSFPVRLTRGPERMLAIAVSKGDKKV